MLTAKTVSMTNPDGSNVRVSNYINIIDKQHVFFINQEYLKVLNKGKWIEVGKVIYNWRNYKNIKITEDNIQQKQVVNDFIQNIEIMALKKIQRLYK